MTGDTPKMAYSGANEAHHAREMLGKALEALQKDEELPNEALGVARNIARSVGALFEAERASSEPDGKTCVRNALSTLSQTMALLQDVKSEHPGVRTATESIADVLSSLYPLTNKTSAPPPKEARIPPTPVVPPPPKIKVAPSSKPSKSVTPIPSSMLPPPAPTPAGPRARIEANVGATTQSNFYVGFSGEIRHGGVFLATYETLGKDVSVRMLVTLPGGFEFECDGYVRFVRDPLDFTSESEPGMGIQFENLTDDARELVLRFIRKRPPMFYDL